MQNVVRQKKNYSKKKASYIVRAIQKNLKISVNGNYANKPVLATCKQVRLDNK